MQFGGVVPFPGGRGRSPDDIKRYHGTNPDTNPAMIEELISKLSEEPEDAIDILDVRGNRRSILHGLVRSLKRVCHKLGFANKLNGVCYGTLLGGGLDAYCFKAKAKSGYGIMIPEGLFFLTSLFCRVIILLQPIVITKDGPGYSPSAVEDQALLTTNPYIRFRVRDAIEALFLYGDPRAAIPYMHAVPFQDRFSYLLEGTELFVLAHEAAHILLGHLDRVAEGQDQIEMEIEADALAVKIVAEHFSEYDTKFGNAEAALCANLFLLLTRLWERGLETITGEQSVQAWHSHPAFQERLGRFLTELSVDGSLLRFSEVFYASVYATGIMADDALSEIAKVSGGIEGLSARVLPPSHAYLGHLNIFSKDEWSIRIARLLASESHNDQSIGLWLTSEHAPEAAAGIYRGLLSEESSTRQTCERAIIAIEPMYRTYITRLRRRYRENAMNDALAEYIDNLSIDLSTKVKLKLYKANNLEGGPMSLEFFKTERN
jgi:hypothetical protein